MRKIGDIIDLGPVVAKHHGYKIVLTRHPTPVNPSRTAYDIMDGDAIRKANISTIELCKSIIDTMIRYGYWRAMG